jgi:hypothetical protein
LAERFIFALLIGEDAEFGGFFGEEICAGAGIELMDSKKEQKALINPADHLALNGDGGFGDALQNDAHAPLSATERAGRQAKKPRPSTKGAASISRNKLFPWQQKAEHDAQTDGNADRGPRIFVHHPVG